MVDAAVVNDVIDADGTVVVVVVVDVVVDVVDVDVDVDVVDGSVVVGVVVDMGAVELVVDVDGTGAAVGLVVEVELVVPVGTVVAGGVVTPDETVVLGETVTPMFTSTEIATVFAAGISNTFQVRITKPAGHFLAACTTARDFVFTQTFRDLLAVGTVTFFVPEGHWDFFEMTSFLEAL